MAEGVFVGGKEVGSAVREGESAGLAVSGPEKKLAVSREVIELNPSTRQLRKKAGREDARSPPDSGSQAGRDGLLGVAEDAEVRDNQLQIRRAKGRNALVESRQPRARSTGSAGSVARASRRSLRSDPEPLPAQFAAPAPAPAERSSSSTCHSRPRGSWELADLGRRPSPRFELVDACCCADCRSGNARRLLKPRESVSDFRSLTSKASERKGKKWRREERGIRRCDCSSSRRWGPLSRRVGLCRSNSMQRDPSALR